MYVYLLKNADGKRFKIGKANNIPQRIRGIGGTLSFDLPSSLCVQLPSEGDAYRIEKILHRLFVDWHLKVDQHNRYDGDTEQFGIECFARVVKFLTDNSDLTAGAMPRALPPAPIYESEADTQTTELREHAKVERRIARVDELMNQHDKTLQTLRTFMKYVSGGSAQCGIWSSQSGTRRLFTSVLGDKQCLEFIGDDLPITTFLRPPGGGIGGVLGGSHGQYDEDNGTGFFINEYRGASVLYDWISGTRRIHQDYGDALPKIRVQIEEMIDIVQQIPVIDDAGVLSLMQLGCVVRSADELGVDGLLQEVRQVMLALHKNKGKCFFRVDLTSSNSVHAWIIKYCVHGLDRLGFSDVQISSVIDEIRVDTKNEVAMMPKEVDDMFGGYVYA